MTATATLIPSAALTYGGTYTATIKGGTGGSRTVAGNPLAADGSWTFSAESIAAADPRRRLDHEPLHDVRRREILKAEGLNNFSTLDVSLLSPVVLSYYHVVDPRRHAADADAR